MSDLAWWIYMREKNYNQCMLNKSHSRYNILTFYLLIKVYYLNFEQNLFSVKDILLVFLIFKYNIKYDYCLINFLWRRDTTRQQRFSMNVSKDLFLLYISGYCLRLLTIKTYYIYFLSKLLLLCSNS